MLGLLRRLRCHVGFSEPHAHSSFEHSDLGNPHLVTKYNALSAVGWDFRPFMLMQMGCALVLLLLLVIRSGDAQYDVYNYLPS